LKKIDNSLYEIYNILVQNGNGRDFSQSLCISALSGIPPKVHIYSSLTGAI